MAHVNRSQIISILAEFLEIRVQNRRSGTAVSGIFSRMGRHTHHTMRKAEPNLTHRASQTKGVLVSTITKRVVQLDDFLSIQVDPLTLIRWYIQALQPYH